LAYSTHGSPQGLITDRLRDSRDRYKDAQNGDEVCLPGGSAHTVAAMRFFSTTAIAFVALLVPAAPARAEWTWPLRGQVITAYRNGDDPYAGGQHRGIDIAGPVGAEVTAATGGEVRFAATAGSSGLTVSVRTSDGLDTSYLHLSSVSVREGELVSSGDALGAVGLTGSRSASEPHLHFGVREAGTRHAYRNPLDFLPPAPVPPAPETPHPAPSPTPAPKPFAPVPSPAGEPAQRRVPMGGRAPRRVPVGGRAPRRVPVGGRAPRRVPVGGRTPRHAPVGARMPRHAPGGIRAPAGEPAPRPVALPARPPRRVPAGGDAPRRLPLGEPALHQAPAGHTSPRATPEPLRLGATPGSSPARPLAPDGSRARTSRPADPPRSAAPGPDVGWILACLGLLLAAALLGLTEDGRQASRTGRARLARLLHPLTGR
jgi:Peptidase family M23